MYRLIILITVLSGVLMFFQQTATAHPGNTASDGAHYCWTRCDYWGEVYGERHYHGGGYDTYIDNTPSLYQQGVTNGKNHANKDKSSIRSSAKFEAYEGFTDGLNSRRYLHSSPNASIDCNTSFITWDTPQNEDYKIAYRNSYKSTCKAIYKNAYFNAYDKQYDKGIAASTDDKDNASGESNDEGFRLTLGWIIIGVLGIIYAIGGIIGEYGASIKKWWNG